jgi:L-alanine-DL-glutamate epimerase-like enolase superfamily enzyme
LFSTIFDSLKMRVDIEKWPLKVPFRITGRVWRVLDVLVVRLEKNGHSGMSEAAGVYYKCDTPVSMLREIESLRTVVESQISRDALQKMLPHGGARNALDCALWDLEAKCFGQAVWQIAALGEPRPLMTSFTCGADTPENMASTALSYADAQTIKVKLTGEPEDADRVCAVRDATPHADLVVDANQGFTQSTLELLMPVLAKARVQLIEQPFPVGREALLDGFRSPIPIAADESVQGLADIAGLVGRFNAINIKLDKCGGLTEALAMSRAAREHGLEIMVGNMFGTSLAMAPAFVAGQPCKFVDLDGPLFLTADRTHPVRYRDGYIACPRELWGHPRTTIGRLSIMRRSKLLAKRYRNSNERMKFSC